MSASRHRSVEDHIVEVCKRLSARNLLASADGNVSFKYSEDEILITPTGRNKADILPEDIAVITQSNKILRGNPSGERLMHLEVYKRCPKARAVVHAHPPTAIAWSVAKPELRELPSDCLSEVILAAGRIPMVPYARPGTIDMGEVLGPFLPECRLMILSRHGAICWGEDLDEAYNGMERLEHSAQILKAAVEIRGLTRLPEKEIDVLREMRSKMGERIL